MACVAFVTVMAVNDFCGTYETVGEVYTESFSYCGAWAGAGGQHHCSMWLVGHERRINTKVHGFFFETTGYKVVN